MFKWLEFPSVVNYHHSNVDIGKQYTPQSTQSIKSKRTVAQKSCFVFNLSLRVYTQQEFYICFYIGNRGLYDYDSGEQNPSRHPNEIFQYKIKLKIITIIIAKRKTSSNGRTFLGFIFAFFLSFIHPVHSTVVCRDHYNHYKQIEIANKSENREKCTLASAAFIEKKTPLFHLLYEQN